MDWIREINCLSQKEYEFKQSLVLDANYENTDTIAELWTSQPFLCYSRIRDRIEEMKLHFRVGMDESSSSLES